jgi:hypothetical protein
MALNTQDAAAGAVFIALGGAFAIGSLQHELGTALRMGPGFFPLVLAFLLVALGAVILVKSFGAPAPHLGSVSWRGLPLILVAPVLFGLTVRGLGLVPSIALVVLLSAYASRRMSHPLAAMLTVGLTVFCVLVFSYALGLPIPRFGPWLRIATAGGQG